MIFRDKENTGFYKGKGKGFSFTISYSTSHSAFYVVASHIKKDIRYNTLWGYVGFETFDNAVIFCEEFDYKKHKCLGVDC